MADDSFDPINADSAPTELEKRLKEASARTKELSSGANSFARAITAAFAQGATGAKSFDTVLKSLALRLSSLSLNLALKPVTNLLAGGINELLGGITKSASGLFASNAAPGGVQQQYAKGGIIAAPTYFPLSGNSVGLAGEAGPEAIMPLTRGADGRLGVAAAGGGGGNITVNIATPDADSFRRSDAYLTGLIARAVARGQRGL